MKNRLIVFVALALLGCSRTDTGVRVSAEKPALPAPIQKARNEPVFYNGKTYRLQLTPLTGGIFDLSVAGMSASQQKDAVAVATSSLRYFSCPDGRTGKLTSEPRYVGTAWNMSARCG
jgi:hypothetical protein